MAEPENAESFSTVSLSDLMLTSSCSPPFLTASTPHVELASHDVVDSYLPQQLMNEQQQTNAGGQEEQSEMQRSLEYLQAHLSSFNAMAQPAIEPQFDVQLSHMTHGALEVGLWRNAENPSTGTSSDGPTQYVPQLDGLLPQNLDQSTITLPLLEPERTRDASSQTVIATSRNSSAGNNGRAAGGVSRRRPRRGQRGGRYRQHYQMQPVQQHVTYNTYNYAPAAPPPPPVQQSYSGWSHNYPYPTYDPHQGYGHQTYHPSGPPNPHHGYGHQTYHPSGPPNPHHGYGHQAYHPSGAPNPPGFNPAKRPCPDPRHRHYCPSWCAWRS